MFWLNRKLINDAKAKRCLTVLIVLGLLAYNLNLLIPLAESAVSIDTVNDSYFSIMQITDTQYLSWLNPRLYYNTTQWIVDNSQQYNLKMVVHTGDLVDTPTHISEWEVANTAMMTLYDNGIPYCWAAGNHDQLPPNETANLWLGDSNTDWLGSQYPALNHTLMRKQTWWLSDVFNGKNTAVNFNYYGYRFLIINVEFLANSSTLEWMQTLIKNNPNAKIIVATHDYLNMTGGYGTRSISNSGILDYTWGNDFKKILDQYPNVFMTISAHIQSRTTGANNKHIGTREEVFFNRQELNNQLGAASVRIYSFNLTNSQVSVSTFAVDLQTWLTDNQNQFSFSINLQSDADSAVPVAAIITVFIILVSAFALIFRRKHDKVH